jgi:hypothetical protein
MYSSLHQHHTKTGRCRKTDVGIVINLPALCYDRCRNESPGSRILTGIIQQRLKVQLGRDFRMPKQGCIVRRIVSCFGWLVSSLAAAAPVAYRPADDSDLVKHQ